MQIQEILIEELKPYEKNPRKNDSAVEAVKKSIQQFGFKEPTVIDKDKVIVCGHTRLKAAKLLGLEKIPCVIADDLTQEQIKAFRLIDNKTSELAEWDLEMLDAELNSIEIPDFDMSDFQFEISDNVKPEDFGTDFTLPSDKNADKRLFEMTFIFSKEQKNLIETALESVGEVSETFGNKNKKGNAIYEVVKQWAEQRK